MDTKLSRRLMSTSLRRDTTRTGSWRPLNHWGKAKITSRILLKVMPGNKLSQIKFLMIRTNLYNLAWKLWDISKAKLNSGTNHWEDLIVINLGITNHSLSKWETNRFLTSRSLTKQLGNLQCWETKMRILNRNYVSQ